MQENKNVTVKQCICMISLFLTGSTLILGAGGASVQDVWIVLLIDILLALILVYFYARILSAYPSKDLYDITVLAFGKPIGVIVNLLYIFYCFYLTCLVLRNFSEFTKLTAHEGTPQIIIMIFFMALIAYTVRKGVQSLARSAAFFLYFFIIVVVMTIILEIPLFDFSNLRPVLSRGMQPIVEGTINNFVFPFAETVVFLGLLHFNKGKHYYKTFSIGILIGGSIIILVNVATLLVLGSYYFSSTYFPAYLAVSRVNILGFLERIELLISASNVVGGFIKMSVCLLSTMNGLSKLLPEKNADFLINPISILIIIVAITTYDSTMEMFDWIKVYPPYALFFQVLIPIILWAVIKIRQSRKGKKKNSSLQKNN